MIISCIELMPAPEMRQAMLEILQFIESGLRKNPECKWCGVYGELKENHTILYVEQ